MLVFYYSSTLCLHVDFTARALKTIFVSVINFHFYWVDTFGHAQRGIHEYPFIFFKKRKRVKGQSLETKPDICKMLFRSCFLKIKRLRSIQKNDCLLTPFMYFSAKSATMQHIKEFTMSYFYFHIIVRVCIVWCLKLYQLIHELYLGNICMVGNLHFHQRLILISDGRPTNFTISSPDDSLVLETDEVLFWILFFS